MADAGRAIDFVLSNEGGFIDNANDSGGATNFGLSLRFLREIPSERLKQYGIFTAPEILSVSDIRELTIDQAKLIYKCEFWDVIPFEKIETQATANYIFDCAVLHGINQAIKLLQRAIWAAAVVTTSSTKSHTEFKDDGILGEKTLYFLEWSFNAPILVALIAERAGFMRLLCVENPKNREFLDGWLNRCYRI